MPNMTKIYYKSIYKIWIKFKVEYIEIIRFIKFIMLLVMKIQLISHLTCFLQQQEIY